MTPVQPNPFADPNAALRQFNAYFGNLRKAQGEDAIRASGFTPRDLAALQASLRKLQMDPNATPEMHQQAYQQARDALAQRLTTPVAAQQLPMAQPQEIVVTGTPRPPQPEPAAPVMEAAPMPQPLAPLPTMSPEVAIQQTPVQTNPISNFIANMNAPQSPMAVTPPGAPTMTVAQPPMDITPSGMPPMGPITPPTMPSMTPPAQAPSMNTQAGADFDRNNVRRIFDSEFDALRQQYGTDALRAAGFTPRTLAALQAPLTKLQMDNSSTYDQHSAALENALQQLRGYNFASPQPAPQPPEQTVVATRPPEPSSGWAFGPIAPIRQTPEVTPMPMTMPAPVQQPVAQAAPVPQAAPVTGMYRGGFAVRR